MPYEKLPVRLCLISESAVQLSILLPRLTIMSGYSLFLDEVHPQSGKGCVATFLERGCDQEIAQFRLTHFGERLSLAVEFGRGRIWSGEQGTQQG